MKKKFMLVSSPRISRFYFLFLFSFLLSVVAYGQTVTGTVTNETIPLSGVTVQVKGKSAATATNNAGQFTIEASGTDILLISSVGFLPQEIAIGGRSSLIIDLTRDAQNLNEVVV